MPLTIGDPAPWFTADTPDNPEFAISTLAGRFVLFGFVPDQPRYLAALGALQAARALFDDTHLCAFLVVRDAVTVAQAANNLPGLRIVRDRLGEVTRLYGMIGSDGAEPGRWLLLDPNLRVAADAALAETAPFFAFLSRLPWPDDHAGVPQHAPVLIVPRVFEPRMCQRLIDAYAASGGELSGVMRQQGDMTRAVVDDFKRRRDATITDERFRAELRARLARRLAPEIRKAFQFEATRVERYIVACYEAETGGYFRPHRDNTTKATVHRRFAASINLNAGDYDGGELRFPEYGSQTYRPPTGGAVVFSCSLLHEATPVTRGRRYAFLPFFYDEDGERVRQQNLRFLEAPDPA